MRLARLAGVGGILLGSFGSPATTPKVALVNASPAVVTGAGYTAGARFFVSYRSGATHVRRRVAASVAGRFRIVLAGVTFRRCDGLLLTAAGPSVRLASCAAGGRPVVTAKPGGLVSGARFVPGERASITVRVGDLVLRGSARAGSRGTLRTRFSLPRAACSDIEVRAVGALGSTATFTVAMPTCKKP
ncbi:MAG TPA: hypothetical protein VFU51_07660 [Gaiellaceae bacterium]|nr:hypothetical protein [Gaiellaceae bacterium]